MKYINEYGFVNNNSRSYFILKALLFCDALQEKKEVFGNEIISINETITLSLLNQIALSIVMVSGISNAELIAQELEDIPITMAEINELISKPLHQYLSIQVTLNH
ncbi:hypothetical protein IR150_17030 [Providencia alcalifaciens]|uniref:hypothetical protein n=1 Tax=Providencia alcalifaciens TaxID=126385 RepID=UPI0015D06D06|nr:hypothetical protein [Providencia alcalifaciens]MBF0693174.1 hypothetical protein [Providencia alcalifaciens]NYS91678.1 hypothetical protein [Providencia alcalifaciens]